MLGVALLACAEGEGGEGGERSSPSEPAPGPRARATSGFVDEALCAGCHAAEAALWEGSHHDLAMQEVSADTVLADFGAAAADPPGPAQRFFREGDGFFFEAEGADGTLATFPVDYVFGVEPLQQYLTAFPGGRLQCLTTAWDSEREEWFSLHAGAEFPPGDGLHWTGLFQSWNTMCAECHSTGLVKGYDAEADTFETTWERIDVGCQACHGPGAEHVEWAGGEREDGFSGDPAQIGLVDLSKGLGGGQLDACARCHSRRANLRAEHAHGTPFLDGYVPERLHEGLYHADGQILDEVYVYGSFVQSRMHANGVTCSDCHEPHTLELLTPGNSLCLQCHSEHAPLDRFPTLTAKRYDDPSHHFHPEGSPGAACVECHMPAKTYMQVDPRRDHSFRIPRPDLSAELGVPNACNGCHADRSAEWAAERVLEWYGPEEPSAQELAREYPRIFARARAGEDVSALLAEVARDPELAAIVRATALDLLPVADERQVQALRASARDAEDLVRISAANALGRVPGDLRVELGVPLLTDPLRSVRVAAARALVDAPEEVLPAGTAAALARAKQEYAETRELALDTPAGWLNLGVDRQSSGDLEGAAAAYRRALEMDRAYLPATFNLATLLSVLRRGEEALRVIESGLEWAPESGVERGELHFSLGLLHAELGDLEAAGAALTEAARRVPERERLQYNLGLVLWRLGRLDAAEAPLRLAMRQTPDDLDVLNSLARLYLERGDKQLALEAIAELERLAPGEAWIGELREAAR